MRDIKFRAWDKHNKAMRQVNDLIWFQEGKVIWSGKFQLKEDEFVLMQYTGLKDKNNREIYEGDIIKSGHLVGEVIWDEEEFSYGVKSGCAVYTSPKIILFDCEVIGNIYENPGLLKGGNANDRR